MTTTERGCCLDEAVTFLRRVAPFADLPDPVLARLAGRVHGSRLPKGSLLTKAGSRAEALLLVRSGIVRLESDGGEPEERPAVRDLSSSDPGALGRGTGRRKGRTARARDAVPWQRYLVGGELLGEHSVLGGAAEVATAVALTDVEVLRLGRDRFDDAVREDPELAVAVVHALGSRLERALAERRRADRARVVAVVSLVANTGRTTLATGIASALVHLTRASVLLLDPNVASTSLTRMLGISSDADYVNTLVDGGRLDPSRITWKTKGGFEIVLPPRRKASVLRDGHLLTLLSSVLEAFDYVVVDSTCVLAAVNREVLKAADQIVLVRSSGDSSSDADRAQFDRMVLAPNQIGADRLVVVDNMVRGERAEPDRLAAGAPVRVPLDAELLARCEADHTIPFIEAPSRPWSRAVSDLACRLAFDRRLVVSLPWRAPGDGRQAVVEAVRSSLAEWCVQLETTEEPGASEDGTTTSISAWTSREALAVRLHELVAGLERAKLELSAPYVGLAINGRTSLL